MFEHRRKPLLSRRAFAARLARSGAVASALIAVSLAIGVIGYHVVAELPWIDALLNASMILTGMGPVDPLRTPAAKIFASAYALFSGVAFLTVVGVAMAPIVHRFLHRFHLEVADGSDGVAKRVARRRSS
jgi:hypothetical protein